MQSNSSDAIRRDLRAWIFKLALTTITAAVTSSALATRIPPPELPLVENAKAPIIFVGEVVDILSDYPSRALGKPATPRGGRNLMARVRVLETLKTPKDGVLPETIFIHAGVAFELSIQAILDWDYLVAELKGRQFIFFAREVREDAQWTVVYTGRPLRAEPREKERFIRVLLGLPLK